MLETLLASLATKIAAGTLAVAMASTGAVAATGNLPDQMQTGISEAVDNIGIDIPLGETEALAQEALAAEVEADLDAELDVDADVDADVDVDAEDGEDAGEPNENAAFGQSVAADAKDGGVDGQEISERAHAMAQERKAAGQANRPESMPDEGEEISAQSAPSDAQGGPGTADQYKPSQIPGGPDAADQYKPSEVPGGPGTADQYRSFDAPGRR